MLNETCHEALARDGPFCSWLEGTSQPDLQPVYMQLFDCFLGAFFSRGFLSLSSELKSLGQRPEGTGSAAQPFPHAERAQVWTRCCCGRLRSSQPRCMQPTHSPFSFFFWAAALRPDGPASATPSPACTGGGLRLEALLLRPAVELPVRFSGVPTVPRLPEVRRSMGSLSGTVEDVSMAVSLLLGVRCSAACMREHRVVDSGSDAPTPGSRVLSRSTVRSCKGGCSPPLAHHPAARCRKGPCHRTARPVPGDTVLSSRCLEGLQAGLAPSHVRTTDPVSHLGDATGTRHTWHNWHNWHN